jgi:glycosyltransferase involved in cell wall biosynthesis
MLDARPIDQISHLDISVVVPVHNESGAVETLVGEIAKALDGFSYEMIFVDDASKDDTHAKLVALKAKYPALRVLANRKNAGQSRAIMNGVLAARGPVIGTLDGDKIAKPKKSPRAGPIKSVKLCCKTGQTTVDVASKWSSATCSCVSPILTICTAICQRLSSARGPWPSL